MKQFKRQLASIASPLLFAKYYKKRDVNWNKHKFACTISFDLDYSADCLALPTLIEDLDSKGIKASFACIGKWIERYPKEHALIIDSGHEIINHTYSHPDNDELKNSNRFDKISKGAQEFEIAKFEEVCEKVLSYKAVGFRAPHFGDLNNQNVYEILANREYLYSSGTNMTVTKSHGYPYFPSKMDFKIQDEQQENNYDVLELPIMSCPVHYFPVFDTTHCYHSNPPAHSKTGEFFSMFKKSIQQAEKYGLYANYYFDPKDTRNNPDFDLILDFVSKQDAWLATSEMVAKFYKKVNSI